MKCDFCNDGECCGEIGRLKEERDALRAEVEAHVKLNEPSKVTKYMAEAIRLEKERDALRAALEAILIKVDWNSDEFHNVKQYAETRKIILDALKR